MGGQTRGRGRGRNRDEPARAGDSTRAGDRTGEGSDAAPAQRFEEISLFDLDDGRVVEEVELEAEGINAVFSVFPASSR